jgi:hypothetical protein
MGRLMSVEGSGTSSGRCAQGLFGLATLEVVNAHANFKVAPSLQKKGAMGTFSHSLL